MTFGSAAVRWGRRLVCVAVCVVLGLVGVSPVAGAVPVSGLGVGSLVVFDERNVLWGGLEVRGDGSVSFTEDGVVSEGVAYEGRDLYFDYLPGTDRFPFWEVGVWDGSRGWADVQWCDSGAVLVCEESTRVLLVAGSVDRGAAGVFEVSLADGTVVGSVERGEDGGVVFGEFVGWSVAGSFVFEQVGTSPRAEWRAGAVEGGSRWMSGFWCAGWNPCTPAGDVVLRDITPIDCGDGRTITAADVRSLLESGSLDDGADPCTYAGVGGTTPTTGAGVTTGPLNESKRVGPSSFIRLFASDLAPADQWAVITTPSGRTITVNDPWNGAAYITIDGKNLGLQAGTSEAYVRLDGNFSWELVPLVRGRFTIEPYSSPRTSAGDNYTRFTVDDKEIPRQGVAITWP